MFSRTIIDESRSIIGDSRVMPQLVTSIKTVIFFKNKATDLKSFHGKQYMKPSKVRKFPNFEFYTGRKSVCLNWPLNQNKST